jgi:hypothetical protein
MRKTGPSLTLLGLLLLVAATPASAGSVVVAGSDYLTTLPGTTFGGAPFQGVAFGPGNTDTIVRRQQDADVTNGSASIPVELVALQLVSALPVDFGLGLDLYYITLQSVRGGPASAGRITILYNGVDDQLPDTPEGPFSSFFDVFFDVRKGALNGPIALSQDLLLTNQGAFWDATPSPGLIIVPGLVGDPAANLHVNKIQNSDLRQMDFFPLGPFQETHPTGAVHNVTGATPEPATWLIAGGGVLALLIRRRRGRPVHD